MVLKKNRKELEVIKQSADEASEFAESIINTVREPLIALDQDLRVVTASRSFYEFFKVKPEETVGQLIYDLGNKQWDIPKLRELLETILPQKATFDNYEVEHDFATIGKRIMLLNARQIQRVLGKERIILLAIEDITERKEIENGLKKAHEELKELAIELKRTARVKSEFLANMSHELRTPLNSIIGYTKLILDGIEGEINDEQRQDLKTVYANSKHLLELINGLLNLSRIEAGKTVLNYGIFTISDLLSGVIPIINQLAREKGLALTYTIDPTIEHLYADKAKTKQVLINILDNAIKFTDNGSVKLNVAEDDNTFVFSVSDTGIGMKKEDLEVIFDSFKQVGPAQIAGYEGTGLGLSISKNFIELQGGRIWAESELGKGSTFTFTLPKKKIANP
jgi:two-component system CheB/CheR fusion protein